MYFINSIQCIYCGIKFGSMGLFNLVSKCIKNFLLGIEQKIKKQCPSQRGSLSL